MNEELLRAPIFHTPRNPFRETNALEAFPDGGLLIHNGRIAACGDYSAVSKAHPHAPVRDLRGGYLLPGLIDTHVHFPQLRMTICACEDDVRRGQIALTDLDA